MGRGVRSIIRTARCAPGLVVHGLSGLAQASSHAGRADVLPGRGGKGVGPVAAYTHLDVEIVVVVEELVVVLWLVPPLHCGVGCGLGRR